MAVDYAGLLFAPPKWVQTSAGLSRVVQPGSLSLRMSTQLSALDKRRRNGDAGAVNESCILLLPDLSPTEVLAMPLDEAVGILAGFWQEYNAVIPELDSEPPTPRVLLLNRGGPRTPLENIPYLQKHFGGNPTEWLDMPVLLIRLFADSLNKQSGTKQESPIAQQYQQMKDEQAGLMNKVPLGEVSDGETVD